MDILIVNDHWEIIGGTETRLRNYVKKLETQGHKVHYYSLERRDVFDLNGIDKAEFHNLDALGPSLIEQCIEQDIPTVFYPHDYFPVCWRRTLFTKHKRCPGPSVIRCTACNGNKPLNLTRSSVKFLRTRRRLNVYLKVDRFKVVSQFMKNKMATFGFPLNKIDVDTPEVDPQFKNYNWKRPIDILYVGGRKEYKGYELFLEAKRKMDQLEFREVHHVPFHEMPKIYNKSKVLLVPSLWEEPFGLGSLEAKACGCKVVASNIGGLSETNPDYLFGPSNLEDMMAKIKKALK